jgi:hypothetical protein
MLKVTTDVSFSIDGPTLGKLTVSRNLSDEDASRVMAFVLSAYGVDGEGNARTPQEAMEAMQIHVLKGIMKNVVNHEKQEAMSAAKAGVSDIEVS